MCNVLIRSMVCVLFPIALFSCGRDSGNLEPEPDTMTVTISDQAGTVTKTYTEGSNDAQGYLDPVMISSVSPSHQTLIQLYGDDAASQGRMEIFIGISGSSQGSYSTGWIIEYLVYDGMQFRYYFGPCSDPNDSKATLDSISTVGNKIIGSFSAIACPVGSGSDPISISGTFSVTRENY